MGKKEEHRKNEWKVPSFRVIKFSKTLGGPAPLDYEDEFNEVSHS